MKFKTPTDQPVTIALLTGHTITIQPDGSTDVPAMFRKAAVSAECEPLGMDVTEVNPGTQATNADLLKAAIEKMVEKDDETDFTGAGKPDAAKLSALVGFNVTAKERDAAWKPFQDLIDANPPQ